MEKYDIINWESDPENVVDDGIRYAPDFGNSFREQEPDQESDENT